MHRVLFGASVAMFMISAVTLGLIMQELNTDKFSIANRDAQLILATAQVTSEFFPCSLNLVMLRHFVVCNW